MTKDKKLDLVTLEVVRNALPAISNEMSWVLQRASYNMMIYEVRDYCCGLIDQQGDLLSQNVGGVSHFVADLGTVIKAGIEKFGISGFKPGDVIVTNHQRVGGQHLNNVMVYTPFFFQGELFAFPCVRAHWVDVGGTTTGFGWGASDPWMEGLQLDQIKIYEAGKLDEKMWQLIRDNIRYPDASLGDFRSQMAACHMAERRLEELLKRYGRDVVVESIQQIMTETESRCRSVIQQIPDGTYEAESMWYGEDTLKIKVKVIVSGSDTTIDLTECSPQSTRNNSRTLAGPRIAYKAITGPVAPVNEGSFRALKVLIQEGNFMMARYPAPMQMWSGPIPKVVDTILLALAPAIPDKVPAGHHASLGAGITFFGNNPDTGERFVSQSIEGAGWGGRPWEDGESASVSVCQGDVRNAPIEKIELKWPLLITRRELRQDSGGAGKFRGGMGIIMNTKTLVDGVWNVPTQRPDRQPPFGLWGGKPGLIQESRHRLPGEIDFKSSGEAGRRKIPAGTEIAAITGGGGGWGNPLERDPELVRQDVIEGFVSVDAAYSQYGVAINAETFEINRPLTSQVRKLWSSQPNTGGTQNDETGVTVE